MTVNTAGISEKSSHLGFQHDFLVEKGLLNICFSNLSAEAIGAVQLGLPSTFFEELLLNKLLSIIGKLSN